MVTKEDILNFMRQKLSPLSYHELRDLWEIGPDERAAL